MAELLVRVLVGGVLAAALAGKLAAPRASHAGLANLGLQSARAQWIGWSWAVAAEAGALLLVVVGQRPALLAPAALFAGFALLMARSLRAGAAGRACGCFGARGTISRRALAGNAALSLLLMATAFAPSGSPDADVLQWAAIGALTALAGGLGVAVLALAREIGALRIAIGSTGVALELEHEGPPTGRRLDVSGWVGAGHDGLAVAVFTSAGCVMCQGLGPAIDYLAQDPWLAVARFDEEDHQAVWRAFDVPGSPYAVVLDASGAVLAKGTFNGLPQLEGLVASAARRRAEQPVLEVVGAHA